MRTVATEGDELWKRVQASNVAWLRGEPRAVEDLFAADVVMITPDMRRIEGRAAMVQGFVDYVSQVRTQHFREIEHSVDVHGDVAVLTYTFDVRYQVEETTFQDHGQEVLVFARRGNRFEAIWRTQITLRSRELAALVEP
jgi:ketosteroid isomerase-like protein